MKNEALFKSTSDEWPTPIHIYRALNAEFGFTLDPCATTTNTKCARYYTKSDDGLGRPWVDEIVFMNPPYSQISKWMAKAYKSTQYGSTVVCLIPSRTDTRWWHDYAMKGEIRLLRGRIRFEGARHSAPFPSAIVVLRPFGFSLQAAELPKDSDRKRRMP